MEVRSRKSEAGSRKLEGYQKLCFLELNILAKEIVMDFKFEKLTIWQKSMDFGESINTMTSKFQKIYFRRRIFETLRICFQPDKYDGGI